MSQGDVIQLIQDMGKAVLLLSGPLLAAGLVVGLLISVVQVVTSIHDPTLSFVPRILVVLLVGMALTSWMMNKMIDYTTQIFSQLARYAG